MSRSRRRANDGIRNRPARANPPKPAEAATTVPAVTARPAGVADDPSAFTRYVTEARAILIAAMRDDRISPRQVTAATKVLDHLQPSWRLPTAAEAAALTAEQRDAVLDLLTATMTAEELMELMITTMAKHEALAPGEYDRRIQEAQVEIAADEVRRQAATPKPRLPSPANLTTVGVEPPAELEPDPTPVPPHRNNAAPTTEPPMPRGTHPPIVLPAPPPRTAAELGHAGSARTPGTKVNGVHPDVLARSAQPSGMAFDSTFSDYGFGPWRRH